MKAALAFGVMCLLLAGCGTLDAHKSSVQSTIAGAAEYTLTWSTGSSRKDLEGTNFDKQFLQIVRARWMDLLEQKRYDGHRRGDVVLQFRLNSDGRITDMKVTRNTAGLDLALMCEMALLDPAPYSSLRMETTGGIRVRKDYREIVLAFQYR